jgi:formylglycine-generating enzyme required for sulfatase activity
MTYSSINDFSKVKDHNEQVILSIGFGDSSYLLARIAPGIFFMGGNGTYDGKMHKETILHPYYIGVYPVTQMFWNSICPNIMPSKYIGINRPVDEVSIEQCVDFINILRSRSGLPFDIPTEAQWEFAARGGLKSNHYTLSGGNDSSELFGKNEIDDGYQSVTYDVGIFKPNELGIYDMNSNVAEWCKCTDCYNRKHLLKGGVLGYEGGLIWEQCSIVERIWEDAESYTPNKGLRLVLNIYL